MGMSPTVRPSCCRWKNGSAVNSPRSVASTSRSRARSRKAASFSGRTASVMRSWASETRISQGASPWYLSGARARSSRAPPGCFAISPTEEESPPAPLSVMAA